MIFFNRLTFSNFSCSESVNYSAVFQNSYIMGVLLISIITMFGYVFKLDFSSIFVHFKERWGRKTIFFIVLLINILTLIFIGGLYASIFMFLFFLFICMIVNLNNTNNIFIFSKFEWKHIKDALKQNISFDKMSQIILLFLDAVYFLSIIIVPILLKIIFFMIMMYINKFLIRRFIKNIFWETLCISILFIILIFVSNMSFVFFINLNKKNKNKIFIFFPAIICDVYKMSKKQAQLPKGNKNIILYVLDNLVDFVVLIIVIFKMIKVIQFDFYIHKMFIDWAKKEEEIKKQQIPNVLKL